MIPYLALPLEAPLPVLISVGSEKGEEVLFRQAKALRYANRWFEAAEAYRQLLRQFPQSGRVPEARFWLGSVLEQDQRWEEAIAAYTEFLTLHSDQRMLGKEAKLNRVRCWGVRQWDSPQAAAGLVGALSEEAQEVRVASALQLAKRGDKRAVPNLQQGLGLPLFSDACRIALAQMGVKPDENAARSQARFLVVRIQEKGKSDVLTIRIAANLARAVTGYLSNDQLAQARLKGVDLDRITDNALQSPKGSELFSVEDKESRVWVTVE